MIADAIMIDPDIFRSTPERYAREENLRERLTSEEREVVQDEIVRRWHRAQDEKVAARVAPKRVPPKPAMYDVSGRLWKSV